MNKPLLNFIAKAPYGPNYDPLLGRDIVSEADFDTTDIILDKTGSVFDDPDLDFAYVPPNAPVEKVATDQVAQIETNDNQEPIDAPVYYGDYQVSDEIAQEVAELESSEIENQQIDEALPEAEVAALEEVPEPSEVENIIDEAEVYGDIIDAARQDDYNVTEIEVTQNEEKPQVTEDLFAKSAQNKPDRPFIDLFGPIMRGGKTRIRNLGPILGAGAAKTLDVGPILAAKPDDDSHSKTNIDIFNEPIFAKKQGSHIENLDFGGPIFGRKPATKDETGLDWPDEFNRKKQPEIDDIAPFEDERSNGELKESAVDVENSDTREADALIESNDNTEVINSHADSNYSSAEPLDNITNDASFDAEISTDNIGIDTAEVDNIENENLTSEDINLETPESAIEEISNAATSNVEISELDTTKQTSEPVAQIDAREIETSQDISIDEADGLIEADKTTEEASIDASEAPIKTRGDILREKYRQAKRNEHREKLRKEAIKAKKKKKNVRPVPFFAAVFLTGCFVILSSAALLAPLGAPFDAISFAKWYIATIGFVAVLTWAFMRYWIMAAISGALLFVNLMSFVPSLGAAPRGGKADKVIGWVDLNYSAPAFEKLIKAAENNKTDILFIARANLTHIPANWSLLQAPIRNDPNSITILSKGNWAAATLVGEPTMARLLDNSITIIAVNPTDQSRNKEKQAERESMINRAAARAGTQETPVIAIGSFDEPAWSRQMIGFSQNGLVKRIRCGGYLGATVNNGLFNLAPDHAFARGLVVAKCNIGGALPGGAHRAIWLSVRSEEPAK